MYVALGAWEKYVCPKFVRNAGIREAYKLVQMEDRNSNSQTIGPVSKAMNMLCAWVEEGPDSSAFKSHVETVRDFFWQSPKGMLVCGTNGSQLWDAAFAAQMLYETGLAELEENKESVNKLLGWIDDCQMQEDTPYVEVAHRHPSKGAWPFSTREQHYTVSDCTAEGLKAVIYLQSLGCVPHTSGTAFSPLIHDPRLTGTPPTSSAKSACAGPSTFSYPCRTRMAALHRTSSSEARATWSSSTRPRSL